MNICVCFYSSYQLILSFPHLVAILTTLGTPKNIFCYIMNNNSKQDHLGKNKFGCTLFAELSGRDTRALPRIFRLFWIPKKDPYLDQATQKKILAKFSYPKTSRNRKFHTQKNPSIIPVTWSPENPLGFHACMMFVYCCALACERLWLLLKTDRC